ncbi:hypothetical protein OIU85_022484 [Salix viminalis]|uniref:Uncharacterized protein n=1 Tax=Salix viminalis TaxID=40686 RepID=A0A9Q0U705_SALVM|nr:hypothetical protein OIU85_022484 [Salix viminalis]
MVDSSCENEGTYQVVNCPSILVLVGNPFQEAMPRERGPLLVGSILDKLPHLRGEAAPEKKMVMRFREVIAQLANLSIYGSVWQSVRSSQPSLSRKPHHKRMHGDVKGVP